MPIANCIVTPDCPAGADNLVELWAKESGQSARHMTVNVVTGRQQFGKKYKVMATLYLPTLWSDQSVDSLQTGLAKALAIGFNLTLSEVHVVTTIVNSGMVVDEGKVEQW